MTKKGNCINFGNCPKADRNEIIELSFTEDFVCPECQQELIEIVKKPSQFKKILIPGSILLLIVIIIGGGYTYFNIQKNKVKSVVSAVQEGAAELESATKSVEENETTEHIETNVVKNEKSEGDIKANSKQKIIKTINFPFGYYKGETVNGLMHGIGTLYFTQSQIISSKDPKKRMAESGDNVNGTWYKGYLDQGKWYSKSGEIKGVINIGH